MTITATRTEIKQKIDHLPEESLTLLAQFLEVIEKELLPPAPKKSRSALTHAQWLQFVEETYGCMRDDPLS
jgi:hypothetical protein